jgi:SAM-dependent MidA family methyltransferase
MKMPNEAIREEIRAHGVISFARFMELALYCPETGYYESKKDTVGRGGDFITSVSVGSLFGELLAFQFAEWLGELEQFKVPNEKLKILEAGAHDGKLARDILNWLQFHRPKLFSEIEYVILEPSAHRQAWQRETLKNFTNVRWENLQTTSCNLQLAGILFGNELLDAFPVHRFGWDAQDKAWFEWGVTTENDQFAWRKMLGMTHEASRIMHHFPAELLAVLPDGYIIETSPAAENWWREAAGILTHGKLIAIDYGFTAAEIISPARVNGTLRAYHHHRVSDDLLANVGEQDLTAHVNFSAIQSVGEAAGLHTEDYSTQPQFLTQIFARAMQTNFAADWNHQRTRQFQTLTHPEHLGRAFRVLVQGR